MTTKEGSIHCHNRGAGCTWSGTYEELGTHLRGGCSARFERCEKCGQPKSTVSSNQADSSCQCSAQISRILCPFCPEQLNRSDVTSHIQKCRLVTQPCENCGAEVQRSQLREHKLEDCGATFVPCPFSAPSFHRKQLRRAAKLNEKLVSHSGQTTEVSPSDLEDDESDYNNDEDEGDEYSHLDDLQGCEHELLRRDEVRGHITHQAEAHLAFAVAALKEHRNCLETTRLDLEDEKEARQRFQNRAKSLESKVHDLEEELSFVKAKLEKYVGRYGEDIADESASATEDEGDIDDIDLDGDEKAIQEEMSRVASLIWSAHSTNASASVSKSEAGSEVKSPEDARKQLLASLPPRKRMLANLLIQAQRQKVQSVVCAPNAHDDVSRKHRQGRKFYSRSELLSLRRSVMDSLAMRDTYPDVGASIYVDIQDNRAMAQSASTSTPEGAAAAALARLRKNRQESMTQRQREQPRKSQTTIIMGASLNGGAGIGRGLKPGLDAAPLVKTWQKKGGAAGNSSVGRRGNQQETIIDTRSPVTTDHLGNKLSKEKLNSGLTRASKPWVPRALKGDSSNNPEVTRIEKSHDKKEDEASISLNPAMIAAGEEAARILRGMLNKVTAANIPNFSTKLWTNALGGLTRVEQVEPSIETLFEKAVTEAGFTGLYAQLVKSLVRHPEAHPFEQYVQSGETKTKAQRTLHWVLISRCRREFEAAFKSQMDLVHSLDQNGQGKAELSAEDDAKAESMKRRLIGVLRFLGELYKNEQLLDVIMFACVDRLLDVVLALIPRNPSQTVTKAHRAKIEILIDEITTLLHNILPNMVFATSERSPLPSAKRDELRPVLEAQKTRLMSLADNPVLTTRAKILLLNLFGK